MIGQLTGFVGQVEADRCLIDVNGVGYVVSASTRTLSVLPTPPETARVLVETVVREDAIQLFGFATGEEREWFRLLTTVQGVGAKVALAILSVCSPGDLVMILSAGDKTGLTRAQGVGARLAERILTELRSKVAKMPGGAVSAPVSAPVGASVETDALLALAGLGFRRAEAWPVLSRVLAEHDGASLDAVIRLALKDLAR
ncbi:Holliday junction branch migration protein RuvA [Acidomonas methanolica]|uniref:Holliday junction branch migration complex subunit RuvA n=1 Tax=Acidomonas methanolica NBRC 104435 TaxID=1231351 RepID=A0A023D1T5_ACIMT|nr:Holliday junction branch migration protein RuvA [Acidomonas methanolica]MBU2653439.1 Holliday junction branch migration protein RuvA [Acidomonas methanolica]TCS32391.1 Holliday junction DNA helicase subunit RuvA [Acidomonas methanolica]GAJ27766.1 Holliday junction DNA helicase RuvA [Acidomonas methanolica NBRC 104435]GBQ57598.1 Holliday junction DNA helicase RuvA [Acidomonas methanolica]GEK97828.1 Holliday junction ATP-dependent DNA helicase RuvA [Acidomonas methanolica NBRC 104435]